MKAHPCMFMLLAFIVSAATGVIARWTGAIWIAVAGDVCFLGVFIAVAVLWLKGRGRKSGGSWRHSPENLPGMSLPCSI